MKLILSKELSRKRAAEREVEMLRLEVSNLRKANQRLEQANEIYRQDCVCGCKNVDSTMRNAQRLRQMGSYLLPTIASTNRKVGQDSKEPAKKMTSPSPRTNGTLLYEDGKLVDPEGFTKASFMKPTESSSRKARSTAWSSQFDSWLVDVTPSPVLSAVDSVLPEGAMWACEWCESFDKNEEDDTDQSLKARSRLDDDTFFESAASNCPIRWRYQHRLMKAALRLAQETLWNALREHWPKLQRHYYLEGPEQVRFGREELLSAFGNENFPTEANEMCGQTRHIVIGYVLDVVYLRNAVCHPTHNSTREVDSLLKKAQRLAVLLQDERRSFKIRRLRDELQSSATEVYDEIKSRVGMAALPYAKPWPLYLQRFFGGINVDPHLGVPSGLPEVIVQAAREWQLKYIRPGELNPDYCASVTKATSFIRLELNWTGRRPILPVCQISEPVW